MKDRMPLLKMVIRLISIKEIKLKWMLAVKFTLIAQTGKIAVIRLQKNSICYNNT